MDILMTKGKKTYSEVKLTMVAQKRHVTHTGLCFYIICHI